MHVGQRVYPMFLHTDETGQASWQEYIVVPASDVFVIPDSLSDEVASQFITNPWTGLSLSLSLLLILSSHTNSSFQGNGVGACSMLKRCKPIVDYCQV